MMMKGITNAQLRVKLENIESEIQKIRQSKKDESAIPLFLGMFTIFSIISTVMMVIDANPIFLFFTILGISEMLFFIIYMIYMKNKAD